MEKFVDYCKRYIIEHIDEFENSYYGCDFAYTLMETPNVNGTLTFSAAKAKDYLREWWDECGAYWEYERDNFGENTHNPFDEPEAYMVCMVIEGVSTILGRCPIIEENWNDTLELTEEVREEIKEYVKDFNDTELF